MMPWRLTFVEIFRFILVPTGVHTIAHPVFSVLIDLISISKMKRDQQTICNDKRELSKRGYLANITQTRIAVVLETAFEIDMSVALSFFVMLGKVLGSLVLWKEYESEYSNIGRQKLKLSYE